MIAFKLVLELGMTFSWCSTSSLLLKRITPQKLHLYFTDPENEYSGSWLAMEAFLVIFIFLVRLF